MSRNFAKTLLILPVTAYPFLYYLYLEPYETDVTELLRLLIFGRSTAGENTNVFIMLESLGYLLLFHLLFGTYISGKFTFMPSYRFSRIFHRGKWLLRQSLSLCFYGMWYMFLFMACNLAGCCLAVQGYPDAETWRTFGIMYAACASLLLVSVFAVNFGIILWKTGIGFAVCWMGIILLSALSLAVHRNGVLNFLNPMSYATLFEMPGAYVAGKMLYQFLLSAMFVAGAYRYLKTYDIT